MTTINQALVDNLPEEQAPTLAPAMEAYVDLAILTDARISLESIVHQFKRADGNMVELLNIEQNYKDWLAGNKISTAGMRATGEALVNDASRTLAAIQNPSLESNLLQEIKRTFNTVSLNLKTFGKNLNEIKNRLRGSTEAITAKPVLLESIETYRFLTRDNAQVPDLVTSLDEDDKFILACEAHYKKLFDRSTDLSKRFRAAATSKSVEEVREAIDYFDEAILDRQSFDDLTKFNLLGNRVVELDKRGYPKFSKLKGGEIKFTLKAGDTNNLVSQITAGSLKGFAVGGTPKVAGIAGVNVVQGKAQFGKALKGSKGEVAMADFLKVLDRAQKINQDSVRFAQMAASMLERVARMSDDLNDAYDKLVDQDSGEFDKVFYRELIDLHKAARRSVSQYMFLGKLVATMMEDHAAFIYRGVTTMANQVLKQSNSKETVAP